MIKERTQSGSSIWNSWFVSYFGIIAGALSFGCNFRIFKRVDPISTKIYSFFYHLHFSSFFFLFYLIFYVWLPFGIGRLYIIGIYSLGCTVVMLSIFIIKLKLCLSFIIFGVVIWLHSCWVLLIIKKISIIIFMRFFSFTYLLDIIMKIPWFVT